MVLYGPFITEADDGHSLSLSLSLFAFAFSFAFAFTFTFRFTYRFAFALTLPILLTSSIIANSVSPSLFYMKWAWSFGVVRMLAHPVHMRSIMATCHCGSLRPQALPQLQSKDQGVWGRGYHSSIHVNTAT